MSTQANIMPSGRARGRNPVASAVIIITMALGLLALLGANFSVLALVALVVLGSILILTDTSLKAEHRPLMM
jgi:hypothetical protein